MIQSSFRDTLYHILSAAFCVIVVISNMVSAKMTPLPLLGFVIPAGLISYPLTFLLSDIVTELFGAKKAKQMVYIAFGMNLLSLALIQLALLLPTDNHEIEDAFRMVLGLSGLRVFSSLIAYAIAQIVSIQIYALLKQWTSSRFLWVRNNGAAFVSQIIDTVAVDMIFLYWGLGWGMEYVLPVMLFSYLYKSSFSLISTPFLYLSLFIIKKIEKESVFEIVD